MINEQFPISDKSTPIADSRAYWLSWTAEIADELESEVFDVHSIAGMRWRRTDCGRVTLEFDTRYVGYEQEVSWQPYSNIEHLEVLRDYIDKEESDENK
jgi:hypothetical protein